jgi:hypothetical protein
VCVVLGFELRQGLHLEAHHQPFLVMSFFEIGLVNYLPRLASNQILLSSAS